MTHILTRKKSMSSPAKKSTEQDKSVHQIPSSPQPSTELTSGQILQLQRVQGNRFVQRMIGNQVKRKPKQKEDELTGPDKETKEMAEQMADLNTMKAVTSFLQHSHKVVGTTKKGLDITQKVTAMTANEQFVENMRNDPVLKDHADDFAQTGKIATKMESGVIILSLVEKALTVSDPKLRKKFIDDIKKLSGKSDIAGLLDVVKFGIETGNELLTLTGRTVVLFGKVTKNAALVEKATSFLNTIGKAGKALGVFGASVDIVVGLTDLVSPDSEAQDRLDGGVKLTTGSLGMYATIAGSVAASAASIAITITYEEAKWLAANVYSPTVTSFTMHGMHEYYDEISQSFQKIAKDAVEVQHWHEKYQTVTDPGQRSEIEMILNDWIRVLYTSIYETFYHHLNRSDWRHVQQYFQNKEDLISTILKEVMDMRQFGMYDLAAEQLLYTSDLLVNQIVKELTDPANVRKILEAEIKDRVSRYSSGGSG